MSSNAAYNLFLFILTSTIMMEWMILGTMDVSRNVKNVKKIQWIYVYFFITNLYLMKRVNIFLEIVQITKRIFDEYWQSWRRDVNSKEPEDQRSHPRILPLPTPALAREKTNIPKICLLEAISRDLNVHVDVNKLIVMIELLRFAIVRPFY